METVHVDDQVAFRTLASFAEAGSSAPGARDPKLRLADLDEEGVWGQLMFPSRGLWSRWRPTPSSTRPAPRLQRLDAERHDVGVAETRRCRHAVVALHDDAVAELQRVVSLGYQAVMVPCTAPEGRGYNDEVCNPLWAAAEQAGVVVVFQMSAPGPVRRRSKGRARSCRTTWRRSCRVSGWCPTSWRRVRSSGTPACVC